MIAVVIPEAAIREAVRWSAREFLRKSRWLRETIEVTAVSGTNIYPLTSIVDGLEVFNLAAVQFGDQALNPATQEEVVPGTPGWFLFEPPNGLLLSWVPDSDDDDTLILVRAIETITKDATSIPDSVLGQWQTAIEYGALGRLLLMKSSPWADVNLGAHYNAQFTEEIATAIVEAEQQAKAYAAGPRK